MRIYLIGFPGTGKTTLGRKLARALGYSFIDLDETIEEKAGMSIATIFAQAGEAAFRKKEWEALQKTAEEENVVVATGGGTPLFHNAMEWMNQHGLTIFLRMPIQQLYRRLSQSETHRPVLSPPDGLPLYQHIRNLLKERLPTYHQAQLIVDAAHISPPLINAIIRLYHDKTDSL